MSRPRLQLRVMFWSMALPQPGSVFISVDPDTIEEYPPTESGQYGLYHYTEISPVLAGGNFKIDLLSWSL